MTCNRMQLKKSASFKRADELDYFFKKFEENNPLSSILVLKKKKITNTTSHENYRTIKSLNYAENRAANFLTFCTQEDYQFKKKHLYHQLFVHKQRSVFGG